MANVQCFILLVLLFVTLLFWWNHCSGAFQIFYAICIYSWYIVYLFINYSMTSPAVCYCSHSCFTFILSSSSCSPLLSLFWLGSLSSELTVILGISVYTALCFYCANMKNIMNYAKCIMILLINIMLLLCKSALK